MNDHEEIIAKLRDKATMQGIAGTDSGRAVLQRIADEYASHEAELASAVADMQRRLGQYREVLRLARKYLRKGWLA